MTIIDATTESGRRYRIDLDGRFWVRISAQGVAEPIERIWQLKVGTALVEPWRDPESWVDADAPEVGKHLYVAGRDVWYVSTLIQNIVEVPSWHHGFENEDAS